MKKKKKEEKRIPRKKRNVEIFNKNILDTRREKDLPFKTHFVPFQYLNRLSRYKVSKV